jgi:hypothetical protein
LTFAPGIFPPLKELEENARFHAEVSKDPIRVNWPSETLQLVRDVEALRQNVRQYQNKDSAFHSMSPAVAREVLGMLNERHIYSQQFLVNIPKRIPWIWLALIQYYGPFSSSRSLFSAIKNYLRFASLELYHECSRTLRSAAGYLSMPPPAGTDLVPLHSRWEHGISIFFDSIDLGKNEDVVVAYVTDITGVRLNSEVTIYGPESDAKRAYSQSMSRKPIISDWFAHYLVPQVELILATQVPEEPTSYKGEAWIRKVTTLSGSDVRPARPA